LNIFKKTEKLKPPQRERERERKPPQMLHSMHITQLLFINHKSILKMESITQIHPTKARSNHGID
jgi:hypothetical protein